jgi:ribosome-binding factor A
MSAKRLERLESQMVRELADILLRKVSDPRLRWVTITRVQVTADLQHAKIFFSTLQAGEQREQALAALEYASGYIRHELGQRLELRVTPQIRFLIDDEMEKAEKVWKIMEELHPKGGPLDG